MLQQIRTSPDYKEWSNDARSAAFSEVENRREILAWILESTSTREEKYRVLDCAIDYNMSDIDFSFLFSSDTPVRMFRYFVVKLFHAGYLEEYSEHTNPRIKGFVYVLQSFHMDLAMLCNEGDMEQWNRFHDCISLLKKHTNFSLPRGSIQQTFAINLLKLCLRKVAIEDEDGMIRGIAFSKDNIEMLVEALWVWVPYYLLYLISLSHIPEVNISDWKEVKDGFENGWFDAWNEIHRALAYIDLVPIMRHKSVAPYISRDIWYEAYSKIFEESESHDKLSGKLAAAEIEVLAYEATLLREYIMKLKAQAESIWRELIVVPNYSYGYLPVGPLVDELEQEGIEIWYGEKMGSSGHHGNTNVFWTPLFTSHVEKIVNQQPIILVVDGSSRLQWMGGMDEDAGLYPDSYKGFLHHIMALNDALWFADVDEYVEKFWKPGEDIANLQESTPYKKCRDLYTWAKSEWNNTQRYAMEFWQTSARKCMLRTKKQWEIDISPMNAEDIHGPTLVFCNVWLMHEELPNSVQDRFTGTGEEHRPGFFDDTGHIINIQLQHNERGIVYHNNLEDKLREAYMRMRGIEWYVRRNSSLVRHIIAGE